MRAVIQRVEKAEVIVGGCDGVSYSLYSASNGMMMMQNLKNFADISPDRTSSNRQI